ncbi:MAG: hypothetical protein FJ109_06985 [Deltaproteobacteria bacterium]|nr:hypothetical protein [Deltaproteobacteria bacterium]
MKTVHAETMLSRLLVLLPLAITLAGGGCGAGGMDTGAAVEYDRGSAGWGGYEGDAASAPAEEIALSADYGPPPPPEEELILNLKAPQASQNYVYIAATDRDSLVRISADDPPQIDIIPVGGQPTIVATVPGSDTALVINYGTQDLSIVRTKNGKDDVTTLDVLPYVNLITVSPDGKYAIVYYNDLAAEKGDPVGDFQTVSVIVLKDGDDQARMVSTGFHITDVYFHKDKPIAYLVTDDGISVLLLDKVKDGVITPIIPVSQDPLDDPEMREVLITEDGDYAVVRNLAKPVVSVVDLDTESIVMTEVEGLPTDVDLIPGIDKVLIILREQHLAYVLDLKKLLAVEDDALVPIDIEGSQAGAAVVTSDGTRAVLYTTVGMVKALAVMDLTHPDYPWKSWPVQKGVVNVSVSRKGTTAIVFHQTEGYPSNASSVEKTIATTEGFTLFNIESGYRKLIQTEHRYSQHLFVADEQEGDLAAYVLTPDPYGGAYGVTHSVQDVDLTTYISTPIPIASEPVAMVYIPLARKVAVAQDHQNGRITFIDVDTGKTWSVTGYEINGMIH